MNMPPTAAGSSADRAAADLPVVAARARVAQLAAPVAGVERIALRDAVGRALAVDIIAPFDVPPHDNAAMDGYAFDGAVLTQAHRGAAAAPLLLRLAGGVRAGPMDGAARAAAGECVRIMTGAPLPAGCDTVIPQECVEPRGDAIGFDARAVARGAHCRHAGEDLRRGTVALPAGRLLRAAELGLLASLGFAEVAVRRRVRVAFFSTGDELRAAGAPLAPGCIYDSNRHTLLGMLQRCGAGVEPIDLGIVGDDRAALAATLQRACADADLVLASGGVSVGDADFTRALLASFGDVAFWRVAMRPGRPLACGRLRRAAGERADAGASDGDGPLFFGLPGNPVATMVAFCQFVRDALFAAMGVPMPTPLLLQATTAAPLRKRGGRTEFVRGNVTRLSDGTLQVVPNAAQGSGILRSMTEANCFIVLEHERGNVAAGETVDVQLFDGLF